MVQSDTQKHPLDTPKKLNCYSCPKMATDDTSTRVPLLPLPNVVHFPGTRLRLHIFEPRYRELIQDLLALEPAQRRIGMVLTRPLSSRLSEPDIYPAGTAGRLIEVDPLPDGCSNIVLRGEFRFRVQREIGGSSYRQAWVAAINEPWLDERTPGIVALRRDLTELVVGLANEIGDRFPVDPTELSSQIRVETPGDPRSFERLVNGIAAELDLPVLRKLALLNDALPQRAIHLAQILRSRREALDFLRPYRHLADTPGSN